MLRIVNRKIKDLINAAIKRETAALNGLIEFTPMEPEHHRNKYCIGTVRYGSSIRQVWLNDIHIFSGRGGTCQKTIGKFIDYIAKFNALPFKSQIKLGIKSHTVYIDDKHSVTFYKLKKIYTRHDFQYLIDNNTPTNRFVWSNRIAIESLKGPLTIDPLEFRITFNLMDFAYHAGIEYNDLIDVKFNADPNAISDDDVFMGDGGATYVLIARPKFLILKETKTINQTGQIYNITVTDTPQNGRHVIWPTQLITAIKEIVSEYQATLTATLDSTNAAIKAEIQASRSLSTVDT